MCFQFESPLDKLPVSVGKVPMKMLKNEIALDSRAYVALFQQEYILVYKHHMPEASLYKLGSNQPLQTIPAYSELPHGHSYNFGLLTMFMENRVFVRDFRTHKNYKFNAILFSDNKTTNVKLKRRTVSRQLKDIADFRVEGAIQLDAKNRMLIAWKTNLSQVTDTRIETMQKLVSCAEEEAKYVTEWMPYFHSDSIPYSCLLCGFLLIKMTMNDKGMYRYGNLEISEVETHFPQLFLSDQDTIVPNKPKVKWKSIEQKLKNLFLKK